MLHKITLLAAGLCAGIAVLAAPAPAATPAYITAAVADPARPASDTSRDAARKPGETIAFVGIKPGDQVGELLPGGGYFTRIIAKTVGPRGHVYAINPSERAAAAVEALAADPAYGNISSVVGPLDALKVPVPLDVVWTTQNYHDLHNSGTDMAPMNKAAFNALKPGGVYLVSDHAANAGASLDEMKNLHRIDPAIVKREVTAAGFVLAGESNILHNTTDNHTVVSHDPSMHDKTDQFVLLFRKPR